MDREEAARLHEADREALKALEASGDIQWLPRQGKPGEEFLMSYWIQVESTSDRRLVFRARGKRGTLKMLDARLKKVLSDIPEVRIGKPTTPIVVRC
jgi:hypothetical protein